MRVGQREGDLLHRRRARLADVVAGDGDRVPARHLRRRRTRRCPSRACSDGRGGKMYVPRATYSFSRSFWTVPESSSRRRRAPRATASRSASRIAAVELIVIEIDTRSSGRPSVRSAHVVDRRDRDARPCPTSPRGHRVVGVVPHLGRQVERHREARLALLQQDTGSGGSTRGAEPKPAYWPHRSSSATGTFSADDPPREGELARRRLAVEAVGWGCRSWSPPEAPAGSPSSSGRFYARNRWEPTANPIESVSSHVRTPAGRLEIFVCGPPAVDGAEPPLRPPDDLPGPDRRALDWRRREIVYVSGPCRATAWESTFRQRRDVGPGSP